MFLKLDLRANGSTHSELSIATCYLLGIVIAALSMALITVMAVSDKAAPDMAALVAEKLSLSGVENPVTAVLLNFRSYDTLLEIAVLLIVAVAILPNRSSRSTIATAETGFLLVNHQYEIDPVLTGLMKWLVPLTLVVGGYLLWTGTYAPGGAFQAGAVIAGGGVAISLTGRHHFIWQTTGMRSSLCLGLLVFILVAAISGIATGTTLQYPTHYAGVMILVVEAAATLSIASILLMLFFQLHTINPSPPRQLTLKGSSQ